MNRVVALLVLAIACGGRTPRSARTPEAEIVRLRERAAANPQDAELWRTLAEAEFLGAGEASEARAAIDHALELSPTLPALHLLSGWEHERQGKPGDALTAYLASVEHARSAPDAVSPVVAEVALDAINDLAGLVPNYDAQTIPVLQQVVEHPGKLGFIAVEAAVQRLIAAARRRGEAERSDAAANALGCLKEWRAAGPFGPFPMRTFDDTLGAEGAGALAARYDLGEGIGEQETFEGEENDCRIEFTAPDHPGSGSTIVETFVEVEQAGPHLFVMDTASSVKISVDGEHRQTVDRRQRMTSPYIYVPLELTAGRHEIEIKLTTRASAPNMTATLDRPGRIEAGYDPRRGLELPEGHSILTRLLRARALFGRGDPLGAREEVLALEDAYSAHVLTEQATMLGNDPYLPDERREQLERRLLQQAAERDPEALMPAYFLAATQQGQQESFAAMRAVAERFPDHPHVQGTWASVLMNRELLAESEAVLRRLRELVPDNCGTVSRLQELLRGQERVTEANALVDVQMQCNQGSSARLDLFLRQRRWDEARTELERLTPLWNERRVRGVNLRIAIATGDEATEARLRQAIEDEAPESERTVLRRVDRQLAAGRRAGAIRLLDEAATRDPAAMHGLRSIRRDLTGRDELEPYRVPGPEVIARFEASGRTYTEPSVLVWDYMVTRVYPDGSARHLVHQIHKIQSEEALERFGQMRVGGQILVLRSIKPDGRQLEPERIGGLDSIPMSDLEIGDYVEYEVLRSQGPRLGGVFRSGGWSFDNYDEPFDISKLVLVHPASMTPTIEALGAVPAPEEERSGDLRTLTWTVRESEPPPREPNAVPHPPFRSFLRFGFGATWERHFAAEYDALLDKDAHDPSVARLVSEIVTGAEAQPRQMAARLHRWVHENIEATDGWLGQAPLMVHARSGHRTRVLRYLLTLAGLPTQVVLSRRVGDLTPSELSDDSLYTAPVLLVSPRNGESFVVWAGNEGAPAGLLPAPLRGQQAVVLGPTPQAMQLPDAGPDPDRHTAEVDVRFDGSTAVVRVRDEYHGIAGATWRAQLKQVPPAELQRVLSDAYVARLFPGAEVGDVAIENLPDWTKPVAFVFEARVRNYGRQQGQRTFLPMVYPTPLARSAASLPTRETSQLLGGFAQKVVVRIHGIRQAAAQPAINLNGPGEMSYRRTAAQQGDVLTIERTLRSTTTIIPAAGYPEFARFARAVSQAESLEASFVR
ncbi:MAG: DUF3857 domain-containing protein [Myxococcota bacterium]